MPLSAALVLTFVFCGALHDLVIVTIRGSWTLLFTPWFLLLGVGVILGKATGIDFSHRPWVVRAAVNLTYILACLAVTLLTRQSFAIP